MTGLVHYHHPDDEQYSLAYVTLDHDEIDPDDGKVETYQLEETVHVLYTNTGASGTVDDITEDFEAILDEMDESDHTEHCTEFMIESVTRAGASYLRFENGVDKQGFLEYLESSE